MKIRLPRDPKQPDGVWKPRHYQKEAWEYLEDGGKRAIEIWHRRSGKDEICLSWASVASHQRVGAYWHMLPEAAQARKVIWDSVDPHRGQKRIDTSFPEALRTNTRNSDMYLEMRFGSTWQVVGSDNYNSLVGASPVGIVFSEWALADPLAWAYLKPILVENDGWALFITTARGPNHAKRMYDAARLDSTWHVSLLTPNETGLLTDEELKAEQEEYVTTHGKTLGQALFEQEYLCSFEAAVLGSVYGQEMRQARTEGRLTEVPYDPSIPVETWWDLGWRDATSIWFIQRPKGGGYRAIDYYENNLSGLDHYVKVLQEKGYVYDQHLVPHDAKKGEMGSGMTLIEQGAKLGVVLKDRPLASREAGINATRNIIRQTVFDLKKCEHGLDCLAQYHYEWDEKRMTLSATPVHDWSSHGADALRTGANAPAKTKRSRPAIPKVSVI